MYRSWSLAVCLLGAQLLTVSAYSQPGKAVAVPTDEFSKAFLHIYKDYPNRFENVRGKEITVGNFRGYICRKNLPGSRSGMIEESTDRACIFDFGSFNSSMDAEAVMLKLSTKVVTALSQRAMVRYIDSTGERALIRRTGIAEIKDNGFFGYNVLVDVVKKNVSPTEFAVRLTIKGGEGTFYRIIQRNEPIRSPYFQQAFKKIQAQFDVSTSYSCVEQLPGYECKAVDSSGKSQLLMEKPVVDLPDARMEFECLTSGIRSLLGEKYLYYFPGSDDVSLRKVVFIRSEDHDMDQRKSISASLDRQGDKGYVLRVLMYHP